MRSQSNAYNPLMTESEHPAPTSFSHSTMKRSNFLSHFDQASYASTAYSFMNSCKRSPSHCSSARLHRFGLSLSLSLYPEHRQVRSQRPTVYGQPHRKASDRLKGLKHQPLLNIKNPSRTAGDAATTCPRPGDAKQAHGRSMNEVVGPSEWRVLERPMTTQCTVCII